MRYKLHNKSSKLTEEMCENTKGVRKIKIKVLDKKDCVHNKYVEAEDAANRIWYVCNDCGFITRNRTEIYSRVVGYLRPVRDWNKGKKAEWNERKTFSNPTIGVEKNT